MPSKRKTYGIRLAYEDQYDLERMAEKRGIAASTLARIFVQDGIRGYERQQDILLGRIDNISIALERVNRLAAIAIASAAMVEAEMDKQKPAESQEAYVERYRSMLKKHITGAITTGTELAKAFAGGKFD